MNDDSNTGFSETAFDSDSNHTFDRIRYQEENGNAATGSTDFSAMREEEMAAAAAQADVATVAVNNGDSEEAPPAKRMREI
jgi:hypothetical protein